MSFTDTQEHTLISGTKLTSGKSMIKLKQMIKLDEVKKSKAEDLISAQIFTDYIYLDADERIMLQDKILIRFIEAIEEEIEEIIIEI